MNYIDRIATRIGERCRMDMSVIEDRDLLRIYAVLCLVKGTDVDNEDVHDAWSAWRARSKPNHQSLIPFDELSTEVQGLDAPYRDAIRSVATELDGLWWRK